jgi:hypothetical protein
LPDCDPVAVSEPLSVPVPEASELEVCVVAVLPCVAENDRSNLEDVDEASARGSSGAICRLAASKGCHAEGQADDAAAKRQAEERIAVGRMTTNMCVYAFQQ